MNLPPGAYVFTIQANGLNGQTATETFTWTLTSSSDPCDMVMCPSVTTISYTALDGQLIIDYSLMSVLGCPLIFSITSEIIVRSLLVTLEPGPAIGVNWSTYDDLIPATLNEISPFVSQYVLTITGTS